MSADGHKLAAAGKRGFAYCHLMSGRWRLFGNQAHEQSFMCLGGISWYRDLLIVGCQDTNTYQNELRIYPSEKNLDNANIVHTEFFDRLIILTNVLHNHLLVYTADNVVHQYELHWNSKGLAFLYFNRTENASQISCCPS
jgi:hypothetical protein